LKAVSALRLRQRGDDGTLANPPRTPLSDLSMSSPFVLDPALFDPSAISAETLAVNAEIVKRLNAEPPGMTIPEMRERRIQGIGAFPPAVKSPRAEMITIAGPSGPMELRVIAAKTPRGLYFHIHGGGWSIGAPDQNDPLLERISARTHLRCGRAHHHLGEISPRAGVSVSRGP
jgi:hypothetical protein